MGHIYTKLDCDYALIKDYYDISSDLLNWLKDSCIKTKFGDDLVCYHGSPSKDNFAVFNDSSGYGCNSFIGFFSLDRDFAECYTDDGSNLGSRNIRRFAINSKNLFDIKNPACGRFLKANLPDTIICRGDTIDRASFINCLKTEKLVVNDLKLSVSDFDNLKMFEPIGSDVLSASLWEYSCSLDSDKQLQNKPFLGFDTQNNFVIVLGHYNKIKPKLPFSYANKRTEGLDLWSLEIPFDKAVHTGILTTSYLADLSQGKQVNIKLSAEEFINCCSINYVRGPKELTDVEKQKLRNMIDNPTYPDLDFSVDITLVPQKISLDEFNQGLTGGHSLDLSNDTWKLYEDSYCIVNDQKIHIIDWLKSNSFDAVVVKENWAINIICFYKNMIKAITNKKPTDSDNVFETYHYSDALLDDLI